MYQYNHFNDINEFETEDDTDTIVEDGEIRDKARLNDTMSNETMQDSDEIEMVEKNV